MKVLILFLFLLTFGCSAYREVILFPPSDNVFITSGDGNIQKPYTPIGEFVYSDVGIRLPLPILGLIPFKNLDPEVTLRTVVTQKIRESGGDGLINMKISFVRDNPSPFTLGMFSKPGYLYITGTIIKR